MSTIMSETTIPFDQDFLDDIAADVRNKMSERESERLRVPELAHKRYAALLHLKSGVEAQLSAQKGRIAKAAVDMAESNPKAWLEFRAEQMDWRGKAVRFLSAIEKDLIRVNQQIEEDFHAVCCFDAILDHRDELDEADIEPSGADIRLWKHLEMHQSR